MAPLKELKAIPNKSKCVGFGYIHEMVKQLSISNVPEMINYLCLMYYFHGEFFEKAGNDLKICDEGMSIERVTRRGIVSGLWRNTGYGTTWISKDSGRKVWEFVIRSFGDGDNGTCLIGIASHAIRSNEEFALTEDTPDTHCCLIRQTSKGNECIKYDTQFELAVMTRYQFVVDTLNWGLCIKKDADVIGTIVLSRFGKFPKDDTKYKLLVSMANKGAKMTLYDFTVE